MAFRWQADDGPRIVIFGSSLPSSTKKNVVKVETPLTKLFRSAHAVYVLYTSKGGKQCCSTVSPSFSILSSENLCINMYGKICQYVWENPSVCMGKSISMHRFK